MGCHTGVAPAQADLFDVFLRRDRGRTRRGHGARNQRKLPGAPSPSPPAPAPAAVQGSAPVLRVCVRVCACARACPALLSVALPACVLYATRRATGTPGNEARSKRRRSRDGVCLRSLPVCCVDINQVDRFDTRVTKAFWDTSVPSTLPLGAHMRICAPPASFRLCVEAGCVEGGRGRFSEVPSNRWDPHLTCFLSQAQLARRFSNTSSVL